MKVIRTEADSMIFPAPAALNESGTNCFGIYGVRATGATGAGATGATGATGRPEQATPAEQQHVDQDDYGGDCRNGIAKAGSGTLP
jgi:hypothetical protein